MKRTILFFTIVILILTSTLSLAETLPERTKYDEIYEKYIQMASTLSRKALPLTNAEIQYLDTISQTELFVPIVPDSNKGFYEFSDHGKEYGVNRLLYTYLEKLLELQFSYVEVNQAEDLLDKVANHTLALSPLVINGAIKKPDSQISLPICPNTSYLFHSNDRNITRTGLRFILSDSTVGVFNMPEHIEIPLKHIDNIKYTFFDNTTNAYEALSNGEIDFIYSSVEHYRDLIDSGLYALAVPEPSENKTYRIVTNDANEELMTIINKAMVNTLGQLISEYHLEIQKAYLYDHFPMTNEEQALANSLGPIRVMVDDDFAPLSFSTI